MKMKNNPTSKGLDNLYKKVDNCKFCKRQNNQLNHIFGFGAIKPKFMFILINPTYRNLSSDKNYVGLRFPFIGVRQFWRVLADGGIISKKVAYKLPLRKEWGKDDTNNVKNEILKNEIFVTNIVKCCYNHSAYPSKEIIKQQLKIVGEEIKIVKPKRILAFGLLTYKVLTGSEIKISSAINNPNKFKNNEILSKLNVPVIPCYFPIGRGNPKKASIMLNHLRF